MTVISETGFSKAAEPYGYQQGRLYQERCNHWADKWRLFQLMTDYQYERVSVPLTNKNIVLHCLQAGGFGDVSQTYLLAKKIQNQFPEGQISIAIQCENVSEEQVRQLFPTDRFPTEFVNKFNYYESEKVMKRLSEKTGCMIGVAVPIWAPILLGGSPARTFREYGFAFHPDTKDSTLSMGFDSREEGMLFPERQDNNLYEIKTPWMKNTLNLHCQADQERYLEQRTLYHMYMPTWSTQMISLYTIAATEKQNSKPVDVFMPIQHSLGQLVEWGALDLNLLKEQRIGKLTRVTAAGIECIDLGPGKEMRILSQAINKEDVSAIQKHSQPLFGCTGNVSFSEGIVYDKLLIYDLLGHQFHFDKTWHQILEKDQRFCLLAKFKSILIKHHATENETLTKYTPRKKSYYQQDPSYELSDPQSITRKAIKELVQDLQSCSQQMAGLYLNHKAALLDQAHVFNTLVKNEYNCESRVMQSVSRGMILTNYPHLVKLEEQLWDQFREGKMTEERVVEVFNGELKALVQPMASAVGS